MMYIHGIEGITRAQSIGEKIDSGSDHKGKKQASYPDYGDFIPARIKRRMGIGVRMGVTCAKILGEQESPKSVVVGTGMGCIIESVKFMYDVKETTAVSPTSFIQSVHNTVAGQIAINMSNTGYNMTFSHGGFSFESALKDAQLLCEEGQTVLVGGVEEYSEAYADFEGMGDADLSEGVSFFNVSNKAEGARAMVSTVDHLACKVGDEEDALKELGLGVSLILQGVSVPGDCRENMYSDICGIYMSNAAFGLHLACELLDSEAPVYGGKSLDSLDLIAVVNRFNERDCGLIIVGRT